ACSADSSAPLIVMEPFSIAHSAPASAPASWALAAPARPRPIMRARGEARDLKRMMRLLFLGGFAVRDRFPQNPRRPVWLRPNLGLFCDGGEPPGHGASASCAVLRRLTGFRILGPTA